MLLIRFNGLHCFRLSLFKEKQYLENLSLQIFLYEMRWQLNLRNDHLQLLQRQFQRFAALCLPEVHKDNLSGVCTLGVDTPKVFVVWLCFMARISKCLIILYLVSMFLGTMKHIYKLEAQLGKYINVPNLYYIFFFFKSICSTFNHFLIYSFKVTIEII